MAWFLSINDKKIYIMSSNPAQNEGDTSKITKEQNHNILAIAISHYHFLSEPIFYTFMQAYGCNQITSCSNLSLSAITK